MEVGGSCQFYSLHRFNPDSHNLTKKTKNNVGEEEYPSRKEGCRAVVSGSNTSIDEFFFFRAFIVKGDLAGEV